MRVRECRAAQTVSVNSVNRNNIETHGVRQHYVSVPHGTPLKVCVCVCVCVCPEPGYEHGPTDAPHPSLGDP